MVSSELDIRSKDKFSIENSFLILSVGFKKWKIILLSEYHGKMARRQTNRIDMTMKLLRSRLDQL